MSDNCLLLESDSWVVCYLGPEEEVVPAVDAPRGGVTVRDGPIDVELPKRKGAGRPDLAKVQVREGSRASLHLSQKAAEVGVDGGAEIRLEEHDVGTVQPAHVQEVAHLWEWI